jgi:ComF family protein
MMQKNPLLKGLIDFVFPPLCLGCGEFTNESSYICQTCWSRLDTYELPLCLDCFAPLPDTRRCQECGREPVPVYAYGNYSTPLKEIIIQLKFRGIKLPTAEFAPLICEAFQQQLRSLQADMLIPIPLYHSRERERGYNQATLFAERLAELLGLPVREDILIRTEKRKPQAKLSFAERIDNIRGVFAVVSEVSEQGGSVILVDDVVTSGATVREAKKELEQAGYRVAAVAAIAHGK